MARASAIALALLSIAPEASFAADARQTSAARSLASEGLAAFEKDDYERALELFERAEKLHHATTHQLFMARSLAAIGKPVESFEMYRRILSETIPDDAPQAFRDAQATARDEIGSVEAKLGHATVSVSGEGADEAEILVDGVALPPGLNGVRTAVNPGSRKFVARLGERTSAEVTVEITSGENATVSLPLSDSGAAVPAGASSGEGAAPAGEVAAGPSKVPAYALLGVGVAGLAVGGIFGVQHLGKKSDAGEAFDEYGCKDTCTTTEKATVDDFDQDAAKAGTISLIGFGVGAAGLISGVTLLLLSGGEEEAAAANRRSVARGPEVRPYVGWGQFGFSGRF